MNRILWRARAARQLRKLNRTVQRRIRDGVAQLITFPDTANVRRLVNHAHTYRLRIGDYRVFFEHDSDIRIITIEEVKKRNERTY